jgi:outer membrane protein insertion porin family
VVQGAIRAALAATVALPLMMTSPVMAQGASPPPSPAAGRGGSPAGTATPPSPTAATPTPAERGVFDGLPVQRVEVEGNTRTDTALILQQVRTQPGQPYSKALVDVDTVAIAALDRFVTVRAEAVGQEDPATRQIRSVVVRFIVEERALVSAVEIVGNRKFNDTELREGLTVRPGMAVDQFRIETDRKFILDKYHQKGYSEVEVSVDQTLLREKGVVRYQVVEGPSARITKVAIEGNANLKASYIKWRIQTKTYFWIFRKGRLDTEKLQADVISVRDMYLKRGFLDARVSYALDYSEDKRDLTVRFIVIEGPRYRIRNVNLTGNKTFANFELLTSVVNFGPGSYAERDKIEAMQRRIEDVYGHNGYINANIEMVTAYTETPGVVDLNVNITEGEPFTVGRVIVRGNPNIQDRVIRRQIRIYPDQTYDTVLVKKSIDRLKATRIFQDVKVTPVTPPGNPAGVRDALVETAEGQTGRFMVGAGVSTNAGLVGQISIEQQNFDITNPPRSWGELFRGQAFKGAGQYFRILLEPGTEYQRYRVTFEEPYLFDTPYSFSNDLYFFTRGRESWDETRIGDIVTFGRRFGDVWGITLALRAEQVEIDNAADFGIPGVEDIPPATDSVTGKPLRDTAQEILNEVGSHFLTSVKPGITRDTTDSRIFPTTGTRTTFAWEQYGALGGEVDMSKITFNFDYYKTLYTDLFDRKTVLALRNQIGLIPFGDSPFYERFYLGGIGELRGFRFRGVSPRAGLRKDPVGGDFSWVSTAELNFPIYEEFLRGVVFVDVGTVERNIEIRDIRSDVGAGVRVNLPFFNGLPLAVDFAYPTTKSSKENDRTQIISVSLGATF